MTGGRGWGEVYSVHELLRSELSRFLRLEMETSETQG